MKAAFTPKLKLSDAPDLWVVPVWEGSILAADCPELHIQEPLNDFLGRQADTLLCYDKKEKVLLIGLGQKEKASVENLRKAYAAVVRVTKQKKIKKIHVLFPKCQQKEEFLRGVAEGIFLSNHSFTYKEHREDLGVLLEKVTFVGLAPTKMMETIQTIVFNVHFVRNLILANADEKTELLLSEAKKLHPQIKTIIYDKKWIQKEKMGLLLAVNRASSIDPYLIEARYQGNPKSKEHIVLVGKGVTYDTGGLSLKPSNGMLTMKCDMSGAATVLGVLKTIAELKLKVNVTALTPITENCIGSKSYKLGDVYRSYLGKTVEINNTDAEGRLILADTLSYAMKNLKPTCMIDVATLTGSCVIALGDDVSGLFSNNQELADDLLESSKRTDEPIWQLPIFAEYREDYKSDIADISNSGQREGGAIKAAIFLQEFVGDIPWAHLDIAGPAYLPKPKHYNPVKATGHAVRLLVDFLQRRSK